MSKYEAAQWSSIPGMPSFESAGYNRIAILPLMAHTTKSPNATLSPPSTNPRINHSEESFYFLMNSLKDFATRKANHSMAVSETSSLDSASENKYTWKQECHETILVIPNSQLTRPTDWRYDGTPLKCFDWGTGCQRLLLFDGRPDHSRRAHDSMINPRQDFSDVCPSKQIMAVIGVLNCQDCYSTQDLLSAKQELEQWAKLYQSEEETEITIPIRMFVFDSFDETCQRTLDFTSTNMGSHLVAFPPVSSNQWEHLAMTQPSSPSAKEPPEVTGQHMVDQTLHVIMNELAVVIFRKNEAKIQEVEDYAKSSGTFKFQFPNFSFGGGAAHEVETQSVSSNPAAKNDVPNLPGRLAFQAAMDRALTNNSSTSTTSTTSTSRSNPSSPSPHRSQRKFFSHQGTIPNFLWTPLDELPIDSTKLQAKDLDHFKKQQLGRREKLAGDYCLLAGSPLDAYERYSLAMEKNKTHLDPLWYAASVEGCATAYIAMADAGGQGVDDYLDRNFKLPEEVMALTDRSVESKKQADRTKTTLPNSIGSMCEEALAIFCRHALLAPLYAELLLKWAKYTAEKEEAHLHCQWGVGEGCYGGGGNSPDGEKTSNESVPKPTNRWEHSLKSHLALGNLGNKGKEYSQTSSVSRCQRCSDLLQKAVSTGALDPRTRADVAVSCARICLEGIKSSHWGDFNNSILHITPRLRLPRKAAFFTTLAAESMTLCAQLDSLQTNRAMSLWLAAAHLYARDGNGVAGSGNYGWATLRASALHGLSQMHHFVASEQAAELLILLLSEISPDLEEIKMNNTEEELNTAPEAANASAGLDAEIQLRDGDLPTGSGNTAPASGIVPEVTDVKDIKVKTTRKHNLVTKGPFFMQIAPSSFVLAQSKWLENDPIPDIDLPLLDANTTSKLLDSVSLNVLKEKYGSISKGPLSNMISLNCIIPSVKFESCANAQSQYISDLIELRSRMPTSSYPRGGAHFSIYGPRKPTPSHLQSNKKLERSPPSTVPPPLHVISASMIKSESNLLLEQTKAAGYTGKVASASMATFFNPYDNKRKEDEKKPNQVTLVAEGEERIIVIVFSNLLSVALEVPSCHLEFDRETDKIEAPPLSFTIPAKCQNFPVRFPFEVLATQQVREVSEMKEDDDATENSDKYELIGIRVTCMNRPYFITFTKSAMIHSAISMDTLVFRQLPEPASVYQLRNHLKEQSKHSKEVSVKIESVPAQPNLLVSFTTSLTPMDDNATVPVHLSDGEIYTIPPLRLENNFGSSGLGKMERLQIICVGLPGLQDEILFDTDKEAAARGEDVFLDSDSDVGSADDFQELMEYDGLPPLKMKANTDGLSLESINEKSKSQEGSVVTFQIAATHDMGNSLANGGHVRIRFRYRGPSPNPATEIWRRREISLRILRVKGPRISSLSFRSDLSWGSVFSELSKTLAYQKHRRLSQPNTEAAMEIFRKSLHRSLNKEEEMALQTELLDIGESKDEEDSPNDDYILERIGMDQGVHVSGDEVVVLMAVANETSNTIILSNRKVSIESTFNRINTGEKLVVTSPFFYHHLREELVDLKQVQCQQ